MHDEALPDYRNELLQMETGLRWLNETFGVRPRVGWQIDPFGASSITPSLMSLLGYEAVVINRIGTKLNEQLERSQNLEFLWGGAPMNSPQEPILAHALINSKYTPPIELNYQNKFIPDWENPQIN